jgi:hypothetical protein
LYRHALELALKGIIYSSAELAAWNRYTDVDLRLRNEHNLINLAATVSDLLALLFPKDKGLQEAIEVVVETCAELSEIDPNSYSYRYPIDRQGGYSTRKHQIVNLRSFANRMSAVLDSLATVDFGLDLEIDTAQSAFRALESHFPSTTVDTHMLGEDGGS